MKVSKNVWSIIFLLSLFCLFHIPVCLAADDDDGGGDDAGGDDDGGGDDGGDDDGADDDDGSGGGDDDGNNDDGNNNNNEEYDGDDYIKYWTEYAILPKRCITYNGIDMIMFQMYEHGYKQCSDDAMGTYVVPVPYYVNAYLDQVESNQIDMGYDDYQAPDSAQYAYCSLLNNGYYVQIGCTDGTTQSLSVNIYADETCETKDVVEGYDDANIDISDLQIPFKQCQACVVWLDKNDDEVDDQYYENKQIQAPLCSTVWQYKQKCDKKCQKLGVEKIEKEGWNTSDKVLLIILSLFGAGMLVGILHKRQNMSNKDALLEQAAMTATGLQQWHIIGIFILVVVVITVFALLCLKAITWALLLLMNFLLFAYLMKLTLDGSDREVIGPDGTVINRYESDDDDDDDEYEQPSSPTPAGSNGQPKPYEGPQIT